MKVIILIVILILLVGLMCYCLCANASRISRMEEKYLEDIRKSYLELGKKDEENLKNK